MWGVLTIANRAVSRGTNGRPVSIPSAVVAEVDTIKVVESGTIGVEQLTSPWVVSGTVTTSLSGTLDVNVVGDTANLMKSTSGTIAEITNVGSTVDVNIVAQAHVPLITQLYSGTNVAGTMDTRATQITSPWVTQSNVSSTANVVQRTTPWESRLYSGTNLAGSITALQGTDPWTISGTVTTSLSGTLDVNVVGDTANLMKSTGGTISQVTTVSALTSGTVVTTPTGNIPLDRDEYIQRDLQTNVATGVTSYTINLSKGTTNRALKEIYLYCASAGAGMYYDIALGTSTLGEAYYGDTTFLTWDKTNWIASGTITVSLNTGAAAASTVNTTLKYYYD